MTGFAPQCCDANDYLELGRRCAGTGECYDALRPVGASLWFAWPQLLGLPPEALLLAHALLAVLSAALCARTAWRRLQALRAGGPALPRWLGAAVLAGSVALHGALLLPTARNSLADPPAALACAIACWLLLDPRRRGLATAAAGLLLGAAVSIRAFYLYPVLLLAGGMVAVALLRSPRRPRDLLVALALLPVALQFAAVWRHTGSLSFIDPAESAKWSGFHLADGAAGYDTLLPLEAFRWPARCAADEPGFAQLAAARDLPAALCLVAARVRFYLGSYAPDTYLRPRDGDLDRFADADVVDSRMVGLDMRFSAGGAPDGTPSAIRIVRAAATPDGGSPRLEQVFVPHRSQACTFTVWAWSPSPQVVRIALRDADADAVLVERRIALGTQPQRHALPMSLESGRRYALSIGAPDDAPSDWAAPAQGGLLVWDGRLVVGEPPPADAAATGADRGGHRRLYSTLLLAAQLVLAALAMLAVVRRGARIEPAIAGVALGALAMSGQALLIVPEQRFVIVPQLLLWFGGLGTLLGAALRRPDAARPASDPSSMRGSGLRFLAFGALNTGATALLYWMLVGPLPSQAAYAGAYAAGIALAYAGNTLWVFRAAPRWSTALSYPLLYGVQYLAGAALLALLTTVAGLDARVALLPVIAATVPLSYALNRALLRPRGAAQ